ncbi:acyl-CoA synthetase (NDP forming) [Streptomyces sp. SLBN-118]|uniref:bifunctional acetate--CoA ligase family protein/GNAT family N-acetyltransferase n=1 Tax=Streptomyces sp. SLBN-118 TaxID=2768454 RepID=UPI0011508692|nr:bifunctional GNAT family N-acetyltransferase/acetate--CoA ligase family protein [Streptomyces sp. SLBN-118]TQK51390.1 acyl-CoA synthetase (NDP forming) [Streptomyces sp. SLBN-118]
MQTQPDHDYPDHWEADVVLRDGGTARIRPITTEDAERLVSFYEQVSDESKYYRFFAPYPRLSAKDVHRFTHHDYVDRVGLAVTVGGEFIATVRYDRIDEEGRPASAPADEAEVAFLVQDAHQGRGVASALLEHIAAVARERGIRRFAAEVLPANNKMIKVFRDAGYTQKRSFEDGSVHLTLDLEPTAESLAVQRGREQRAEARSVQRLLAPGSVAVVGTGRAPGGVGRTVLRNLLEAGFTGRTYAVNRAFAEDQREIDGVPAFRSVGEIGEPVDLAVVAVPAERVPDVVADCGEHGVQGLVVLTAGYAESGVAGRERQFELVRQARSYGMRIIGPNSFGIISTADAVRLNASLAPESPAPGRIGLFTQSGAIGIALLAGLHRRGAGLSSFISSGNRADVSGNDFLQYWYEDAETDVVLLYLESIGNPRKFTRLARRTAAVKPVVVVKGARHSGSEPPGHAVPVTRIPDATVGALMSQAGVIRVDTVTELVDVGLLLAGQPLPAGPRVAILGNSESLGLLTYDACLTDGLRPQSPLDLTTAATPADFRAALAEALKDDACDAVVVTAIPWVGENGITESGDGEVLAAALREAAASSPAKPVAVVHVEMGGLADALAVASSTRTREAPVPSAPVPPTAPPPPARPPAPAPPVSAAARYGAPAPATAPHDYRIPAYPAAERAVRALSEAVKYAQWRRNAADPGKVPVFEDIDEPGAARRIEALLGGSEDPRGLTLAPDDARALLGRYGIDVRPTFPAPGPDPAVHAAGQLGYPVALKTTAPHLRHRADLGGVRLDLANEDQLRQAYAELTEAFGKPEELRPVVQAMAPRGVDTVVRAAIDPAVGAVLSFGLAGAASELLGDTAHRLVPATDRDAAELIRTIRTAPVLFGWRGSAPVDTPVLEELLLRVSRLVDDHPEVVGISLEPVVVAQRGLSVLDASVRLAPPPARTDLGPRRLPSY